jgi:hypothetical protein
MKRHLKGQLDEELGEEKRSQTLPIAFRGIFLLRGRQMNRVEDMTWDSHQKQPRQDKLSILNRTLDTSFIVPSHTSA